MRIHSLLLYTFCVLFLFNSCEKPPNYSNIPAIAFEKVEFKDIDGLDSLILSFRIQDGNGDLGLASTQVTGPYRPTLYFSKTTGEVLPPDQIAPNFDNAIVYGYINQLTGAAVKTSLNDTIPSYTYPNTCLYYETYERTISQPDQEDSVVLDIVYKQANPYHLNIYVEFYVKEDGQFVEYNWVTQFPPQCGENFNGRFFVILGEPGEPVEVNLRYGMLALSFRNTFRNETLMLKFYIYDRSLNRSNTAQSIEFTLNDIEAP